MKNSVSYTGVTKTCRLCQEEKFLNKRPEIISRCLHAKKKKNQLATMPARKKHTSGFMKTIPIAFNRESFGNHLKFKNKLYIILT